MNYYAPAIWNYEEPDVDLLHLVDEFVSLGYNAISFTSWELLRTDYGRVAEHLRSSDLRVAMHGNFETPVEDVRRLVEVLGDCLLTCTFDAAQVQDTRGKLYDVTRMVEYLSQLLASTDGTDLRVAVEDFPLDQTALEYYRAELAPVLSSPRYGMLVDVGHLNMRLRQWECYREAGVGEYLARLPLPVWEVHLHDNSGDRDEHGHFGLGNVDFAAVAAGLKAIGFSGVSTIEIAPSFHGKTPAESKPLSAESLAQWKDMWEAG